MYSKLQHKRDRIIRSLADQGFTRELAEKLLGAQMITRRIYDQARNVAPSVVEMDRTTVLFNAVLASVELNPAKYDKFITILKEIHGSEDLVAFIVEGRLLCLDQYDTHSNLELSECNYAHARLCVKRNVEVQLFFCRRIYSRVHVCMLAPNLPG